MLRAFRRVRATFPNTLLILAPRHTERVGRCRAAEPGRRVQDGAAIGAGHRRRAARRRRHPRQHRRAGDDLSAGDGGVCRRQPGRRPAGTTSSSRRCSASRSCSGRTCRTSPRSPTPSWPTSRRCRCAGERRARRGDGRADDRSDPPRAARRGGAGLVEANRGAKDKSMTVLAALLPQDQTTTSRPTSGRSDPLLDLLYAQAVASCGGAGTSATPGAAPSRAPRHQRRQPQRRRHGEDAAGRADCAHG